MEAGFWIRLRGRAEAVVDKAMKDIEESMAPALNARKNHHKHRSNNPYYDPHFINGQSKWPQVATELFRRLPRSLHYNDPAPRGRQKCTIRGLQSTTFRKQQVDD
eukprot:2439684-Amphidinium_carterae.1